MIRKKILINASNLHSGGGVQVAASFIYELSMLGDIIDISQVSIICSDSVKRSLPKSIKLCDFFKFDILNIHGFSKPTNSEKKLFSGFDVCFTVFGPVYFKIKVDKHICGFAQPWIAYPDNQVYKVLSFKNKIISKIKFFIQKQYFKYYDELVVEAFHIKDALLKLGFSNNIEVVSNTVSAVFDLEVNNNDLFVKKTKDVPQLGFIGRPYPHKNIEILKDVYVLLKDEYNFPCEFIFTLNDNEMDLCGFSGMSSFKTVGEITLNQCPSFYQQIDALIFPSLLECFSATPIEAMKMGVPVFASNYLFVKDFCKGAAFYFDPIDPESIANAVYTAFSHPELMQDKIDLGESIVTHLPTARDRAEDYVRLILR